MNKTKITDNIKISFRYSWMCTSILGLCSALDGIVPNVQTVVLGGIINEATLILQNKQSSSSIYVSILLLVLTIAYSWLSIQLTSFAEAKLVNKLREGLHKDLMDKCERLQYRYIEGEESQNIIRRVTKEPENEVYMGFKATFKLIAILVRVIGLGAIIMINIWWCGILMFLTIFPLLLLARKNGEITYQADKEVSLSMRKYEYLNELMMGKDSAIERTIFGYHAFIQGLWEEQYNDTSNKLVKAFLRYFFKTKLYEILLVVVSFIIIVFLLPMTFNGAISVGILMSLVINIFALISLVVNQLTFYIKTLARNREYLLDLETFFKFEEDKTIHNKINRSQNLSFDRIEFKKVSFRYPDKESYVLKDISFTIEKGKHYAFVGDNGAGKTTLIKLLTGLYHNYDGEILIGGKELREYNRSELISIFSVIYQDFAKYSVSVFDNIAIGALNNPIEENCKNKVELLEKQLQMDAFINKLPKKNETTLGKLNPDDVELSLGQWQKVALARALIKEAFFYILDEPTSALDPQSEKELYDEYKNSSKGKTTIFISHRLGSIQLADEILVFRNGNLIEHGDYNTLIKGDTLFSKMYEKQRSWYK